MQLKGLKSMPYLNLGLWVQMGFRRQNYQRDHGSGRESHCITSIQKLEMIGGVQNEKKKKDKETTNYGTRFCCQISRFQRSG